MKAFFLAGLVVLFISSSGRILQAADSDEPRGDVFSGNEVLNRGSEKQVSEKPTSVPVEVVKLSDPSQEEDLLPAQERVLSVNSRKKKKKVRGLRASTKSSLYRFADHLPEAEAELFSRNKEPEVLGLWSGEAILFRGYEKDGDIRKTSFNIEGIQYDAISTKMVAGRVHLLKFHHVSPGTHLVVRYVLSAPAGSRDPIFSYLRVLVGQHELKRVQVSSKDPWTKQEMDLGIISFLNREVTVAFELTPERIKGLTFSVVAEMRN